MHCKVVSEVTTAGSRTGEGAGKTVTPVGGTRRNEHLATWSGVENPSPVNVTCALPCHVTTLGDAELTERGRYAVKTAEDDVKSTPFMETSNGSDAFEVAAQSAAALLERRTAAAREGVVQRSCTEDSTSAGTVTPPNEHTAAEAVVENPVPYTVTTVPPET
jgi:hypothetical protein